MSDEQKSTEPNEAPPVFRTWRQVYIFVLLAHAVILSLFYFFTKIYS